MELDGRWIAARPWEARLPAQSMSPNIAKPNTANKGGKNTEPFAQCLIQLDLQLLMGKALQRDHLSQAIRKQLA